MTTEFSELLGRHILTFEEVEPSLYAAKFGGESYIVRGTCWDDDYGFEEYELSLTGGRSISFATLPHAFAGARSVAVKRLLESRKDMEIGSPEYAALLVESKEFLARLVLAMAEDIKDLIIELDGVETRREPPLF